MVGVGKTMITGLGAMNPQQKAKWDSLTCPSGYVKNPLLVQDFAYPDDPTAIEHIIPDYFCQNSKYGYYLVDKGTSFAASQERHVKQAQLMTYGPMALGAAIIMFGEGNAKWLGILPIAYGYLASSAVNIT